ncbi:hypothetical protein ElyMa_000513600 [Elysia marginata]|uniref:Uncharacterized protein n=1 Tax=Elysia marginata TaxID=1093978 RepID=A0AAV4FW86_9GAST|nr:hypothetical protein ElyMa_000513600 [Elysia marginata]
MRHFTGAPDPACGMESPGLKEQGGKKTMCLRILAGSDGVISNLYKAALLATPTTPHPALEKHLTPSLSLGSICQGVVDLGLIEPGPCRGYQRDASENTQPRLAK